MESRDSNTCLYISTAEKPVGRCFSSQSEKGIQREGQLNTEKNQQEKIDLQTGVIDPSCSRVLLWCFYIELRKHDRELGWLIPRQNHKGAINHLHAGVIDHSCSRVLLWCFYIKLPKHDRDVGWLIPLQNHKGAINHLRTGVLDLSYSRVLLWCFYIKLPKTRSRCGMVDFPTKSQGWN